MAVIEKTWTIEAKGVGFPDYTREISSGQERAGIALDYNQQFRVFGVNWVTGDPDYPLVTGYTIAPGGKRSMRDSDTNELLPIIMPAGHTLTIITVGFAVNQDILVYAYIDALTVGLCISMGVLGGGQTMYENKIRELSTTWYDEYALFPHTIDIRIYNVGGGDLYGGGGILCIEEAIGSPPWPTTKECFCPYCNHKQTESVTATRITCKGCGKEYMVTNFASLRQLGG